MADGRYDVVIIGSGAGGGTLAHRLAPSGKSILVLERGDWLPREARNWRVEDVFRNDRYVSPETWYLPSGKSFQPQVHYFVGGATKLFGAALYRLRKEDFGELRHYDGVSPAWPVGYDEFEPYYGEAERLYRVHGARGGDPTEPPCSTPYPAPPVSHEPRIAKLAEDLAAAGFRPFHAPAAVMLDEADMAYSPCIRCQTCDGFPCLVHAKSDAEVVAMRPALEHANVDAPSQRARAAPRDRSRRPRRDGRRRRGRRDAVPFRSRRDRRLLRCRELRRLAAALGERCAPGRPRQRIGPGRAELHVSQ